MSLIAPVAATAPVLGRPVDQQLEITYSRLHVAHDRLGFSCRAFDLVLDPTKPVGEIPPQGAPPDEDDNPNRSEEGGRALDV